MSIRFAIVDSGPLEQAATFKRCEVPADCITPADAGAYLRRVGAIAPNDWVSYVGEAETSRDIETIRERSEWSPRFNHTEADNAQS